jgi:hypothetical protein
MKSQKKKKMLHQTVKYSVTVFWIVTIQSHFWKLSNTVTGSLQITAWQSSLSTLLSTVVNSCALPVCHPGS